MRLWQRLALLFQRFSPLEERLLKAVRDVLPADAIPAFDRQVESINRVQRLPHWAEIDFYRMRRGKVDWTGVRAFPRASEFPLAEVRFRAGGQRYRARLSCIGGHIFDFAITPPARDVAFSEWEGQPVTVLLGNPMDEAAPKPPEPVPEAWSKALAGRKVPAHAEWSFHEPDSVYRVVLEVGEFLVLGERTGADFLLYRLDPEPQEFFVQCGHDGSPVPIREPLAEWLASHSGRLPDLV